MRITNSHIWNVIRDGLRHPRIAWIGLREFRGGSGMTYQDYDKSCAYDSGRELAHILTLRYYDYPTN